MNLILLDPADFHADGLVRLRDRRAAHAHEVLAAKPGERLVVGLLGGAMGIGEVVAAQASELTLRVELTTAPPPRLPLDLILAVPRPKVLRRVLQAVASMGVRRLVLLGTYRVEKSYFASPLLAPEAMEEELRLGLEQAKDTRPPEVLIRRAFKPFVEDEVEGLFGGMQRLVAHPVGAVPLGELGSGAKAAAGEEPPGIVLAIGPEGGFTSYEADLLAAYGFARISLGQRILRVDVAVPYAIGQVLLWREQRSGQRDHR